MFLNIENFCSEYEQSNILIKLCVIVGGYHVLYYIFTVLYFFFSLIRSPVNYIQRYGANSWVLITGPTEGIGKSFCFTFAKRGFNVVLVARNQEKAQGVISELKKLYPNQKYHLVIADFVNNLKDDQFYNKIAESVKDLDISILVNNVGIDIERDHELLHTVSNKSIIDIITVNTAVQTLLTCTLLPKLLNRKSKSAIIDISSFVSTFPFPMLEPYSATKAYNDQFTRSLNQELRPKIDIISLKPMTVVSSMTKKQIDAGTLNGEITAEQFTESSIHQLGRTNATTGHYFHRIQSTFVLMLPRPILLRLLYREISKIVLFTKSNKSKKD